MKGKKLRDDLISAAGSNSRAAGYIEGSISHRRGLLPNSLRSQIRLSLGEIGRKAARTLALKNMPHVTDSSNIANRLEDLVSYPHESLNVGLKGWLDLSDEEHKADLAHAILALANFGGGYLVLGFQESNGTWIADPHRPASLDQYGQDLVNGVVRSYAEPSFHCEVHQVSDAASGHPFPVITVPGNHKVPIRAKRDGPNNRHVRINAYYIRRPGPSSEVIQTADEWNALVGRCIKNVEG